MHVLEDVLARRLQVGQEGNAVGDALEIIDGEFDADAVGDSDKVEDGVGASAENHDEDHSVLERHACHDVARLDILL